MKAAWETGGIKDGAKAIAFCAEHGFDTLIGGGITSETVSMAHDEGIHAVSVVSPSTAQGGFADNHPDAVQKMRDFEHDLRDVIAGQDWVRVHGESFRWQGPLLPRPMMCYEHPEAREEVKRRVTKALETADGIALDGFGFNNYYACFCDRCESLRSEAAQRSPDLSAVEIMAQVSRQSLIDIHRLLHDNAKTINPDAIVTNHVWPKFLPDEYVACNYKLDTCTQTISWFYPPEWRIEQVEQEAAEHKRLENRDCNQFVPFIGIVDMPGLVRKPERLAAEIEIALRYGEGSLVLSRLSTLQNHPGLGDVVREALG